MKNIEWFIEETNIILGDVLNQMDTFMVEPSPEHTEVSSITIKINIDPINGCSHSMTKKYAPLDTGGEYNI